MVDLGTYICKAFTNAYIQKLYESEHVRTATKRLRIILDAKYEEGGLHKVMET